MNNIEMRHYSGHASEKEVLLLPYSCYKIVDDSSSNPEDAKILKDVLTITLEYAGIHSEGAKA